MSVAAKVEGFFSRYPQKKCPPGQILVFSGDRPRSIFYIKSGRVKQYDISYKGEEIVVNTFKEGAFMPMLHALTDLPNVYFYQAETALDFVEAPIADVVTFLDSNPDVMKDLLTRLYIGVDGLLMRMAHLMSGSARGRVVFEILLEIRRFGTPAQNGSYTLDLNEGELASRVGLSRETVSREIAKLKHKGLVHKGTGIRIDSVPKLEAELSQSL